MVQLYVGGLSLNTNEDDLNRLLAELGNRASVELVRDLESGKLSGYALVRIVNERQAESAINSLKGIMLKGSQILANRMPATFPGEMQLRDWLHNHASELLKIVGIKEGHTVLDYGCGPGIFTFACACIVGETGRIFALDVRERVLAQIMTRVTEAGLKNVETILQNEDNIAIGLRDNSLDVVMVYDVMHIAKDKPGLLQELDRILKPDGWLSIFPMHLGNEPMLKLVQESGRFRLRDTSVHRQINHQALFSTL
jgi:SAM-dependent methyltransferase